MPEILSKEEVVREILTELRKIKIKKGIKFPPKNSFNTIGEAIEWSDKNTDTQPHFIVHKSGGHVIIH